MNDKWLATGIDAAVVWGDEAKARSILREYVAHHPDDERGWNWLSRVTTDPADQVECLKRLLQFKSAAPQIRAEAPTAKAVSAGVKPQPKSDPLRKVFQMAAYSCVLVVLALIAVAVVPMFMGNRTIVILSGSMYPAIAEGDAVIAQPVPSSELQVGDVIAYSANANSTIPVVHRITDISVIKDVRYYTTRGDANKSADTTHFTLPATAWRMSFAVPLAGYAIAFAASPIGTLALIIVPIVLLGIFQINQWLKKRTQRETLPNASA